LGGLAVPKTKPEIVEQNPVEVPLYTLWDVARYLHVSLWAVLALSGRSRDWPAPDWFLFHFLPGFPHPLLFDDDLAVPTPLEKRSRISFRRLADLFVRAATFQMLAEWPHAEGRHRDRWGGLYNALLRGLEDTYREPVPFNEAPVNERLGALVEPYTRRLDDGQLALLRKWFIRRLERVHAEDGAPVRIYPFSRDPAEKSPRIIVLDPRTRFGRPTIAERGVPTDSLFERYQAGDSVAELAEDYGLTPAEVEEAVRYEALAPAPMFPFSGW
jgi:uncharacterized protein (DUF433 family)